MFLYLKYGFCLEDNPVNSYDFLVRLDLDFGKQQYPEVLDMMLPEPESKAL